MTILHKADFAVRELYYYDRFLNSHSFDFELWQRGDILKTFMFAQKKPNKDNDVDEFIGYPMIYKCSESTWELEKARCLYKHLVNWKVPRRKIIDIWKACLVIVSPNK